MENKLYPQWKYKLPLKSLHEKKEAGEVDFIGYVRELHKRITAFLPTIKLEDKDLKEEIEKWMEDVFIDENGTIFCVKNDDDWVELEFELDSLYDLGDQKKMIWFHEDDKGEPQ